MTDRDLLVIGCAVTLIAFGGAYIYLRARFLEAMPRRSAETERDESAQKERVAAAARQGD